MIWFTSDLHFFHDRILEFHPKRKEIFGNIDSKQLRADVGIDGELANYDLVSLEKVAKHFKKIEDGMVK